MTAAPRTLEIMIRATGLESETKGGVLVEVHADQRRYFKVDGEPDTVCRALAAWFGMDGLELLKSCRRPRSL